MSRLRECLNQLTEAEDQLTNELIPYSDEVEKVTGRHIEDMGLDEKHTVAQFLVNMESRIRLASHQPAQDVEEIEAEFEVVANCDPAQDVENAKPT